MNLKEFYKLYKGPFPLGLIGIAYSYVKNGHEPATALQTACIIYAAKFTEKPMNYVGYSVTDAIDVIRVHRLQAETPFGISHFPLYDEPKNRSLAVATSGENLLDEQHWMTEQKPNATFGVYEHHNRYVAVVELKHDEKLSNNKRMKELADLMAKNALAWWPEYLKEQERKEFAEKKKLPMLELPTWHDFLLKQYIRFVPHVNETLEHPESFRSPTVTIDDYLKNLEKQTGFEVKVADINLFGF